MKSIFLHCAEQIIQNRNITGSLNSITHHPYTADRDMIVILNFHFPEEATTRSYVSRSQQPEDKMKEGSQEIRIIKAITRMSVKYILR